MKRLSLEERYKIEALLGARLSDEKIAIQLSRSQSTITREINRNSVNGYYDAKLAHECFIKRDQSKAKFIKMNKYILQYIDKYLKEDWSPEQISDTMKLEMDISVSHERIYQYIEENRAQGGLLYKHLRRHRKRYKKRGIKDNRGEIKNKVSIDQRPKEVDEKVEQGHWEGDLVVGAHHKGFLVTLVERVSRYTIIGYSETKQANDVSKEIQRMLKSVKSNVMTITFDNGKEFAKHEEIARKLDAKIYFAHPYSSYERGANE